MDEKMRQRSVEELQKLKYLTDKYSDQGFTVYATFSRDVQGGEDLSNKEIANQLKLLGFYNPAIVNPPLKFLNKVSKPKLMFVVRCKWNRDAQHIQVFEEKLKFVCSLDWKVEKS